MGLDSTEHVNTCPPAAAGCPRLNLCPSYLTACTALLLLLLRMAWLSQQSRSPGVLAA